MVLAGRRTARERWPRRAGRPPYPPAPACASRRAQPSVRELLNPFAFVGLGDEEVALRIDGEIVGAVELPGPVAGATEGADDFQRLSAQNVHLLIGSVDDDEKRLLRIDREPDVPHRSAAERLLRDEHFLNEGAVLPKDLQAIVRTIADVYEPIA